MANLKSVPVSMIVPEVVNGIPGLGTFSSWNVTPVHPVQLELRNRIGKFC